MAARRRLFNMDRDMALMERERDEIETLRREVSVLKGTTTKLKRDLESERGRAARALEKQMEAESSRDRMVEEEVTRRMAEVKSKALAKYLESPEFEQEVQAKFSSWKDLEDCQNFIANQVATFWGSFKMCHFFLTAMSAVKVIGVTEVVKVLGVDPRSLPNKVRKFYDSGANAKALGLARDFGIDLHLQPPPGYFDKPEEEEEDEEEENSGSDEEGGTEEEEEPTREEPAREKPASDAQDDPPT